MTRKITEVDDKEQHFKEIYDAAKKGDQETLKSLQASYGTLDVYLDKVTPVQQLAWEFEIEAVKLLLRLDADPVEAVYGAAIAGNIEKLLKQYRYMEDRVDILLDAIARAAKDGNEEIVNIILNNSYLVKIDIMKKVAVIAAAQGNKVTLLTNLLGRGASLDSAVCGAAMGKHFELMEDLLKRGARLDYAIFPALRSKYFDQKGDALVFLAAIKDHKLRQRFINRLIKLKKVSHNPGKYSTEEVDRIFVKDLETIKKIPYNVEQICRRANKIAILMYDRELSFEQASAWLESKDLRNWLLVCAPLFVDSLKDTYFNIVYYLSTQNLTDNETLELGKKMEFHVVDKAPVIDVLSKAQSFWATGGVDKQHVAAAQETAAQFSTRDELVRFLKSEKCNSKTTMSPPELSFFDSIKNRFTGEKSQRSYNQLLEDEIKRLER